MSWETDKITVAYRRAMVRARARRPGYMATVSERVDRLRAANAEVDAAWASGDRDRYTAAVVALGVLSDELRAMGHTLREMASWIDQAA